MSAVTVRRGLDADSLFYELGGFTFVWFSYIPGA